MSQQNEISARARTAAEAFQFGFAPDEFVVNWRDSASIYFDEFVKAVKDVRHPIPSAYFEIGFCISPNPIFAMLEPKMLHCAMEDLGASRRESFALLEREVFTPYVAAWTKLVQALLARFPNAMAEIQSFASKLQATLGVVRMMATVAGSARGENFERVHNLYDEMCAAFRAVGVKVAERPGEDARGLDMQVSATPAIGCDADKEQLRNLVQKVKNKLNLRSINEAVRYILSTRRGQSLHEECARMLKIIRRRGWSEGTVFKEAKPASGVRHTPGVLTHQGVLRKTKKARVSRELQDVGKDDVRAI